MSNPTASPGAELEFLGRLANATSRRTFLQWAGLTVGVAALGCSDDDNGTGPGNTQGVNLGSGDVGILNYAYALEQLEAAFYIQVIASPYSGITAEETTILRDIRDHEIVHRDFLKAALGNAAIPGALGRFLVDQFHQPGVGARCGEGVRGSRRVGIQRRWPASRQ